MPAVSKAQQRAMYAAAEGKSTLGIPEKVGKEFVAHDEGVKGASVCLVVPDGRILFLLRTDGFWDLPGGHAEEGEAPEQTAERETREEAGAWPYGELTLLDHNQGDGADFSMFRRDVRHAFTPKLDDEHTDHRWATFEDRPEGMLSEANSSLVRAFEKPGEHLEEKPAEVHAETEDHPEVPHEVTARDCLAFDRASVRSFDQDGRLHVEVTHISKANVCPYRGDEIPDPEEELHLDPDRIYMLLRDPEELAKGAPTANNIPVLSEHVPVDAQDHQPNLVIGASGSDAQFNAPYLDNSMVIWVQDAIDGVKDGSQQEISCSYYYTADMTPGTYEGIPYDGVMRDIRFNHIAVVPKGRAGPDVAVGDSLSQLTGVVTMGKKSLSKKAAMAKGALLAILKPKLAADSAVNLDSILEGVDSKNWLTKKPGIVAAIRAKLAKDADMGDVVELIDALDKEDPDDEEENPVVVQDEDPVTEKVMELLRGKVSDEDLQAVCDLIKAAPTAADEPTQTPGAANAHPAEEDNPHAMDETDEERDAREKSEREARMKETRASDTALAAKIKRETMQQFRDIAAAEEDVRPYVGKLTAMDSATDVYKAALEIMGVDIKGVHPSAFKAILSAHPKPSEVRKQLAADSSVSADVEEVFPNLARVR